MTNWKKQVKVDDILAKFDEDKGNLVQVRDEVVEKLQSELAEFQHDRGPWGTLEDAVSELQAAETVEEFDAAWDTVYDWADDNRVWVGF